MKEKSKGDVKTQKPAVDDRSRLILVSFNHPVGIMLDGRAILVGCAICEEIYQATASIAPKEEKSSPQESMEKASSLTLDFPLMLRVISLADDKVLTQSIEIMVKWNNISAICNL
jgi:hypothetical protein